MSISKSGNLVYVDDSTGTATTRTSRVSAIIVTGHAGAGELILANNTSGQIELVHIEAASGSTFSETFPTPLVFNEGIVVTAANNIHVTLVLAEEP
jgi:hypothetical protein